MRGVHDVEVVADGDTIALSSAIEPGQTGAILSFSEFGEHSRVAYGECAAGDDIARDPEGNEVARHPPPLRIGDVWLITDGD